MEISKVTFRTQWGTKTNNQEVDWRNSLHERAMLQQSEPP